MPNPTTLDPDKLRHAITLACDWIAQVSQIKTDALPPDTTPARAYVYDSWKGAMRTEYTAATKRWGAMGPVWHTGQAVRALLLADKLLGGNAQWVAAARAGAQFMLNAQVWDPQHPDHGLIKAFEDHADRVNTSAMMEGLTGLMDLAERDHDPALWDRIVAAGEFLLRKAYLAEEGTFRDQYNPVTHAYEPTIYLLKAGRHGRPLVEDGVLMSIYEHTGDARFRDAHVRVSETLVADQNPPGNWIDYSPCSEKEGRFHPRHNYWWALPLLDTYRHTQRQEFLDTAIAAGEFSKRAMRRDGGWIRGLFRDFNTESFGHATSGSACAAILWSRLMQTTGDAGYQTWIDKALSFCMNVQFTAPQDGNLRGAILEKILPPDGTDRSPYYLRDVGSTFFVIAACMQLR